MKAWAHRHIWQRLPRGLRRRALFSLAALIAPRPGPRPKPSGPFYIAGPLSTASGLGISTRLCLQALAKAGFEVFGIDTGLGGAAKHQVFDFPQTKDIAGPGTLIVHVNGFLLPLAMMRIGTRGLRGKTVIGYWAWELPELPDEWLPGFRYVHEVWTPSSFVAKAVAAKTALPVRVLHHPLPPTEIPPAGKVPTNLDEKESTLTVLTAFDMASSFARKNPLAAIAAFKAAFGRNPDCRLLLKVSDAGSSPDGMRALRDAVGAASNIILVEGILSAGKMSLLIGSADIVLSLHRSEGFGLLLAEGMLAGKVVVATNWSGNTDFMTAENSCPVAYRLVPAEDAQGTYHHPELCWADADIADAARQLKSLRDSNFRAAIGIKASKDASAMFSQMRYASLVRSYIQLPMGSEAPL